MLTPAPLQHPLRPLLYAGAEPLVPVPRRSQLITTVTVAETERLSPAFRRIVVSADELADFGVAGGRFYDQRIKLILPGPAGVLPQLGPSFSWPAWRARPAPQRGVMRSYAVRAVRRSRSGKTYVAIDVVLHDDPNGPSSQWAAGAARGDRAILVGPRRGCFNGGIDFRPPRDVPLVIAADETAVPAAARILGDLPADARGTVFLEVPTADDLLDLPRPDGIEVVWLPRGGRRHGASLTAAVAAFAGLGDLRPDQGNRGAGEAEWLPEPSVDEVWETPSFSSSGDSLDEPPVPARCYVWAAGETTMVATLRERLIRGAGLQRSEGAFMGYWRRGVAMRS